jgi:hypothetical protein
MLEAILARMVLPDRQSLQRINVAAHAAIEKCLVAIAPTRKGVITAGRNIIVRDLATGSILVILRDAAFDDNGATRGTVNIMRTNITPRKQRPESLHRLPCWFPLLLLLLLKLHAVVIISKLCIQRPVVLNRIDSRRWRRRKRGRSMGSTG